MIVVGDLVNSDAALVRWPRIRDGRFERSGGATEPSREYLTIVADPLAAPHPPGQELEAIAL
jgi:hypothetical protein